MVFFNLGMFHEWHCNIKAETAICWTKKSRKEFYRFGKGISTADRVTLKIKFRRCHLQYFKNNLSSVYKSFWTELGSILLKTGTTWLRKWILFLMEILSMCLKELNWTCKTTAEVRLHAKFSVNFYSQISFTSSFRKAVVV